MAAFQFQRRTILRAIDHLWVLGDSDVMPYLPEYIFFREQREEIVELVQKLTLGGYQPKGAVEVISPKSEYGFRIAHQLTAFDNLIYLCAAIECAGEVEGKRDALENERVFSYRFYEEGDYALFQRDRSYHAWLESTRRKLSIVFRRRYDHVVLTDISDFYARAGHHRIENALANLGCGPKSVQFLMKILGKVRAEQSFGIPVGSAASRMIAEALLVETDQFLLDNDVEFSRFVDDFRLFVKGDEAYVKLADLAQHLMTTEGLALNSSKTSVITSSEFVSYLQEQMDDVFSKGESEDIRALLRRSYGSEDEEHEEEEISIDETALLRKLRAVRSRDPEVSTLRAVLRALRVATVSDVIGFIDEFADLFRTVPRDMAMVITESVRHLETWTFVSVDHRAIEGALISLAQDSAFTSLPIQRVWLKEPLATGVVHPTRAALAICDQSGSLVQERRQDLLIKAHIGDTRFFRAQKPRLSEFTDWEKPMLLWGASCLPQDEYEKWITSVKDSLNDPLGPLYASWAKANKSRLLGLLGEPRKNGHSADE